MALFQTKIVWKMPKTRENKNYHFVPFIPDTLQKISKKQGKNYEIKKKIQLWLHFKPKSF